MPLMNSVKKVINLSTEIQPLALPSSINKLIVFDWDDTLFPRTKIMQILNQAHASKFDSKQEQTSLSEEEQMQLSELSCHVYNVLSTSITRYKAHNVFIVTASEKGWIKQSLSIVHHIGRFADIYDILFIKQQITMIHPSKRNLPFAGNAHVFEWKYKVFTKLLRDSHLNNDYKSTVNTFMSFGDSTHEYQAAKRAADVFENILVHRIKFLHRPSFADMMDQMKLLLNFMMMSDMSSITHKNDIAIDYSLKKAQYANSNALKDHYSMNEK